MVLTNCRGKKQVQLYTYDNMLFKALAGPGTRDRQVCA